ncbi:MAG TPA: PqqD family protein [Anaerolineaceae bacterium]|jgi:hypothetical protein|nr:PqqD family protein [Anaerolineaceae bacterium]HUM50025.1 PqqD family protein [Anaerolineaceae bacterium]
MTEKRYQRNEDFIFRKIVEEIILVPIKQNVAEMEAVFTLNEVGAFLWEQLGQPRSLSELHNAVLNEFEADPASVLEDIEAFLKEAEAFGAVKEVFEP